MAANDAFAARQVLTDLAGSTTVSLVGTSREAGEPDPLGLSPKGTVWYEWTVDDVAGDVYGSVDTLGTPNTEDTTIAVYTCPGAPALASLVLVGWDDDADDAPASQSKFQWPLTPGETYYIQVGPYDTPIADYVIAWQLLAASRSTWTQPADRTDLPSGLAEPSRYWTSSHTSWATAVTGAGATNHSGVDAAAGASHDPAGGGTYGVGQLYFRAFISPAALAKVNPGPLGPDEYYEYDGAFGELLHTRIVGEMHDTKLISDSFVAGGAGFYLMDAGDYEFLPNGRWCTPGILATATLKESVAGASVADPLDPLGTRARASELAFDVVDAPHPDAGQRDPDTGLYDGNPGNCYVLATTYNASGAAPTGNGGETAWLQPVRGAPDIPPYPTDVGFEVLYSYRPPQYRILTLSPYVPGEAVPEALLESAGEAGSATSVRVTALPVDAAAAGAGLLVAGRTGPSALSGATPPVGVRIYQPHAVFDQEPWIVAGGRAERAPVLGVNAVTYAHATSYDSSQGVEDALSVTLGAQRRWLADPDTFDTATELWTPAAGATGIKFKGAPGGNQYIDPGYEYVSRIGVLQRNAMVFAGGSWFTATGKMSGGDEWAVSMVFVPHANLDSTRATILNSFQDDPSDPNNFQTDTGLQDLCLDITGDKLMVRTGGRQTYDTLRTISDRPIIVVLSGKARRTRLLVVDRKYASHDFRHSDVGPTDMRLLLGRPNVEITRRRGTARMDLMEIATFNHDLGPKQMWQVASKLDSVYGVSR